MGLYRLTALAFAVAVASTGAFAFQEQQVGGQPAARPSVSAPAAAGVAEQPRASAPAQGTEVRIPGLGKLGVIPKLDFGLELLYGANEPKRGEAEKPEDDGVVVRGTIKHKF